MIPEEIYELGNMLGLERDEIKDFMLDTTGKIEVPISPNDSYKFGQYGTVSINDF
jgi:hypothetical protein